MSGKLRTFGFVVAVAFLLALTTTGGVSVTGPKSSGMRSASPTSSYEDRIGDSIDDSSRQLQANGWNKNAAKAALTKFKGNVALSRCFLEGQEEELRQSYLTRQKELVRCG
jgi:hypothetical protein